MRLPAATAEETANFRDLPYFEFEMQLVLSCADDEFCKQILILGVGPLLGSAPLAAQCKFLKTDLQSIFDEKYEIICQKA